MEHIPSQHWHQAETVREAAREIDRIDLFDNALVEFENIAAAQTDLSIRIRDLMALSNYYHSEFGVHFEKRHAYREQLNRVLVGEISTINVARVEARVRYAASDGFGLPRLELLAQQGVAPLPKNRIVI